VTNWERLCGAIRDLREAADSDHLSAEDFAEYAMGKLDEAGALIEEMGPVARELPSVWRVHLDGHGDITYVGTSDEARSYWHGRAYVLGVMGSLHRSRVASDVECARHDESGPYAFSG
jgi:ribosomal protein S18 acetylase RimI-like enzyme